jgi:hypothetical protein
MEPSTPCGPAVYSCGAVLVMSGKSTMNLALERIETLIEEFMESEIDDDCPEPFYTQGIILGLQRAAEIVRDAEQTTKH